MKEIQIHYADQVLLIERDGVIDQGYLIEGLTTSRPNRYGLVGDSHAWAIDWRGQLHIVDLRTKARSLANQDGIALAGERSFVLPAGDGSRVFLLTTSKGGLALHAVDCASARVLATHTIEGWWSHSNSEGPVLIPDGRIVVPVHRRKAGSGSETGVVFIDPSTGVRQEYFISHAHFQSGFVAVSPDGRYCLRPDFSVLPVEASGLLSKVLGFGKRSRRFGLSMQLWQTEPLQFVRRLTLGWFLPAEMPHESNTATQKTLRDREVLFEQIAEATRGKGRDAQALPPRQDFQKPYRSSDGEYGWLMANWSKFTSGWAKDFAWAPDSKSFWHTSLGMVACTSVDGESSPRMLLERFGYSTGTWLPATRYPLQVQPLSGHSARLTYAEGTAVVTARLSASPGHPFLVPKGFEQWTAIDPGRQQKLYAEAGRLKRKLRRIEIPLSSLDPTDCIAAIELLREEIAQNLMARANEGEVNIFFQLHERELDEAGFFAHVRANCPAASRALRELLLTLCAIPGIAHAELFSSGEEGIGILSHAAQAFAALDPDPIATIQLYAGFMDVEHEQAFIHNVVPAMIDRLGWTEPMLDFAVWLIEANFYNSIDHNRLWNDWGLGRALEANYTPQEYGYKLEQQLETYAREPLEPGKIYRYWILDALDRDIREKSPWTQQLFLSLKPKLVQ